MIPNLLSIEGPPRQGDKDFSFTVHIWAPHWVGDKRATHVAHTFTYPIGDETTNQAGKDVLDDIVEWMNTHPVIQRVHRIRWYRDGEEIKPVERVITI